MHVRIDLRSVSTPARPGSLARALACVLLATIAASAQNTVPALSTFFGGSGREEITALRTSPGGYVTVCGFSESTNLPTTATAAQASNAGGYDAFVARFDPSLPPANQLLFCTYLGGAGRDYAFDLVVDPISDVITVCGSTDSSSFPGSIGQPAMTVNGISDGFVAQLDPSGSVILGAMLVGGSGPDRVTELELRGSEVIIGGVTESSDLPWTAGTAFPAAFGSTDVFVAQIDLATSTGLWATYLGGSGTDGLVYNAIISSNGWEGYLVKMGLAIDAGGNVVVATVSNLGAVRAPTTAGAVQPIHQGVADAYLAVLKGDGSTLLYGTFFGGSNYEAPMAVAPTPGGGFVMGGYTFSNNLPVTPGCIQPTFQAAGAASQGPDMDGWLCHIDPGLGANGLTYSTYLGGNAGEDSVAWLAVESSGIVTAAGWQSGGGTFPTTPRSMQSGPGLATGYGYVSRIDMAGRGSDDLLYSTRVGGTALQGYSWLNTLQLDDHGDAWLAGTSSAPSFATINAYQSSNAGNYDGTLLHLPLLPGCVGRSDTALSTPACGGPLYIGAGGAPLPGTTFRITATDAPPSSVGALVLGAPTVVPIPAPFGVNQLVTNIGLVITSSDALGAAEFELPLAPSLPAACPWSLAGQWVFLTNAACPGSGLVATSGRLDF